MQIPDKLLTGQSHETPIEVLLSKTTRKTAGLPEQRLLLCFTLPPWQRQEVWEIPMKRRFIEGIFLGMGTGYYVVTQKDWGVNGEEKPMSGWLIDGQQRLTAIRDFVHGKFPIFDGVHFADLDPLVARRRFLRINFPSIELAYQPDEAKLHDLYVRMNYSAMVPHATMAQNDESEILLSREPDFIKRVQRDGMSLADVPEEARTEAVCFAAVQQHGLALEFVPNTSKSERICDAALAKTGNALQFFPDPFKSPANCLLAVKKTGRALAHVPHDLRTPDVCDVALAKDGLALAYVPDNLRTMERCTLAVYHDSYALKEVPESLKTAALCLFAAQQDLSSLKWAPEDLREDIRTAVDNAQAMEAAQSPSP